MGNEVANRNEKELIPRNHKIMRSEQKSIKLFLKQVHHIEINQMNLDLPSFTYLPIYSF